MSQIHSKEKTLFKRLLRLVFLSNNFLFLLQSYHFLTFYFFFPEIENPKFNLEVPEFLTFGNAIQ